MESVVAYSKWEWNTLHFGTSPIWIPTLRSSSCQNQSQSSEITLSLSSKSGEKLKYKKSPNLLKQRVCYKKRSSNHKRRGFVVSLSDSFTHPIMLITSLKMRVDHVYSVILPEVTLWTTYVDFEFNLSNIERGSYPSSLPWFGLSSDMKMMKWIWCVIDKQP